MSQEYRATTPTIIGIIPKLAELGFDGMELEAGDRRLPAWNIDKAKKIKEACDSHGLTITNLAPQTDFVNPDTFGFQMEKEFLNIRELCKLANAIEVPLIRVQIISHAMGGFGPMPEIVGRTPLSLSRQFDIGVANLKKAVKIAEEFGVTLGLDNHFFLTVMDHLRIAKAINSPRLGVFLDVINAIINGEDAIATARACGKWLVHSHLKDMYKWAGSATGRIGPTGQFYVRPPIGEGNVIDWEEYLKTLKSIGYKGYLSIEAAHSDRHYDRWFVAEAGIKLSIEAAHSDRHYDRWFVAEAGIKHLRDVNKKVGL
jgi:sugar phosphate isomerase/epimerase